MKPNDLERGDREFDWSIGRELEQRDAEIARLKTALIEARTTLNGPHDGPMSILAAADAFNIIQRALTK